MNLVSTDVPVEQFLVSPILAVRLTSELLCYLKPSDWKYWIYC